MAYSGTTTFLLTRNDIIDAALRGLEVYGPGDPTSASDYTNCGQALNIILKAWGGQGINLWTNVDKSLPLVIGQAAYSVGPTGADLVCNLPLRIVDAYLRTANVDSKVQLMSRYDYDMVSNKASTGTPNQLFYDPQLPNGRIYLAAAPAATSVLHFVSQEAIQDVGGATDNPFVPQEWYQLLKWALMDEVSIEYGCKSSIVAYAEKKADKYRAQLDGYVKKVFGSLIDEPAPTPQRIDRA